MSRCTINMDEAVANQNIMCLERRVLDVEKELRVAKAEWKAVVELIVKSQKNDVNLDYKYVEGEDINKGKVAFLSQAGLLMSCGDKLKIMAEPHTVSATACIHDLWLSMSIKVIDIQGLGNISGVIIDTNRLVDGFKEYTRKEQA